MTEPSDAIARGYYAVKVALKDGRSIEGFARNESTFDLQIQTFDGRFEIVERRAIASLDRREASPMPKAHAEGKQLNDLLAYLSRLTGEPTATVAPPLPGSVPFDRIANPNPGDWPTYNGRLHGNRHSTLGGPHNAGFPAASSRSGMEAGRSPSRTPRSNAMTTMLATLIPSSASIVWSLTSDAPETALGTLSVIAGRSRVGTVDRRRRGDRLAAGTVSRRLRAGGGCRRTKWVPNATRGRTSAPARSVFFMDLYLTVRWTPEQRPSRSGRRCSARKQRGA